MPPHGGISHTSAGLYQVVLDPNHLRNIFSKMNPLTKNHHF
jgi:hypothetical protein